MKLHDPTDTNCSSDSDNQSIVSLSESNSSKSLPEEFVVVPIPDCFKVDQVPSTKNVPEEQAGDDKELVTDSAGPSLPSGLNKRVSEESIKSTEVSHSFDGNNNSEKTNQNSSASGSLVKLDDSLSNDGSQKSDVVVISIPNKEEEDNAGK